MIKKAFILFAVILLSELLIGCYNDDCNCTGQDYYSNLNQLSSTILEIKDTVSCYSKNDSLICHDTKKTIIQKENAILSQNKFQISIDFNSNKITSTHIKTSFLSQAYACAPGKYGGLITPIKTFEIRCSYDILNTKAGEIIDNDKISFNISDYDNSSYDENNISVNEWIQKANKSENGGLYEYQSSALIFNENIISDEYLTFDISVILEDGQTISTKTIPVKIIQ